MKVSGATFPPEIAITWKVPAACSRLIASTALCEPGQIDPDADRLARVARVLGVADDVFGAAPIAIRAAPLLPVPRAVNACVAVLDQRVDIAVGHGADATLPRMRTSTTRRHASWLGDPAPDLARARGALETFPALRRVELELDDFDRISARVPLLAASAPWIMLMPPMPSLKPWNVHIASFRPQGNRMWNEMTKPNWMRESSSGPISEMVVRIGCPWVPNRSHSCTGHSRYCQSA